MSQDSPRLQPHPDASSPPGPVVLVIMDGVGVGNEDAFDAVHAARNHAADRLRDAGRVPPTCLAGAPA